MVGSVIDDVLNPKLRGALEQITETWKGESGIQRGKWSVRGKMARKVLETRNLGGHYRGTFGVVQGANCASMSSTKITFLPSLLPLHLSFQKRGQTLFLFHQGKNNE
jgi:hypothetical protein